MINISDLFREGQVAPAGARLVRVEPQESTIEALADELTSLRWRGLANIDLQTRTQSPVELALIEDLARRLTGDDTARRIEVIRQLLHDALQAYRQAGFQLEAELIGSLLFDDGRGETLGRRPPGDLLADARKARGLSTSNFAKRQRSAFEHFASYLITFVEPGRAASSIQPAELGGLTEPDESDLPPTHRLASDRRKLILLALAAVALIVVVAAVFWSGRSDNGTSPTGRQPSSSSLGSPSATTTAPSGTSPAATATLTFDDLGGGSAFIRVFPGVQDLPRDKTANGTYKSGDKVKAICQARGRTITSDTAAGERARKSEIWIQLENPSGRPQYAPLTYAQVSLADLQALPACPNPS